MHDKQWTSFIYSWHLLDFRFVRTLTANCSMNTLKYVGMYRISAPTSASPKSGRFRQIRPNPDPANFYSRISICLQQASIRACGSGLMLFDIITDITCRWRWNSLHFCASFFRSGSGRIWVPKSGQICLRPDLEKWNPAHP